LNTTRHYRKLNEKLKGEHYNEIKPISPSQYLHVWSAVPHVYLCMLRYVDTGDWEVMKILNLYAGIGGNRKLWGDGHEVTAVELDADIAAVYKRLYPNDTVVVADAHQYLLEHFKEFDFIWSSPPCPTHSRMRTMIRERVYPDMKLYEEIIFLGKWFYGKYVVENVIPYYKPLVAPTVEIDRHYFWSNFDIKKIDMPNDFTSVKDKVSLLEGYHDIYLPDGTKDKKKLLRNAVRPVVGKHVFEEATNE